MTARANILARLRSADVSARPTPQASTPVDLDAYGYRDDYYEQLEKNLQAAHAVVIPAGPRHWRQHVAEICQQQQIRHLMLPGQPPRQKSTGLPPLPWLAPWDNGPRLEVFDRPMESLKDSLFESVDAGLTIADCAIADTGTLVLRSSPWQPRSLSLVPPIHICLLDARCLYPDLPTAMAVENWAHSMPTNLIFVSGPSKTADIQQTLAYGAHGPKQLFVILVAGEVQ